ncbi:MAG TPA: L-threonylcarbamoyladenylate synthase [Thermoanaerobaculaceae bacterium]|nr:L-threonylcarbamoyladenylate synthase [Thermoanaerobaculaceae bacterium]
MLRLPFTGQGDLAAALHAVRDALQGHAVVGLPTETFYGLAVAPDDTVAVDRVYTLKGRSAEKALPVVGASIAQLESLVVVPEAWRARLEAAWPAPFTVVLTATARLVAGGRTLAVRVPAHPLLRALLASVGPLTATSANRSGGPALARADDVARVLGDGLALLLDGGDAPGGVPTTVVDLTHGVPRIARQGAWQPPPGWGVKGR